MDKRTGKVFLFLLALLYSMNHNSNICHDRFHIKEPFVYHCQKYSHYIPIIQ